MSQSFCDYETDCVKQLNLKYSNREISVARHKAKTWRGRFDYTEQLDLTEAWAVAHTLTSDSAWGEGRVHKVDESLLKDVADFFADLLGSTEPMDELRETPSVINFIVCYMHAIDDPSFVPLLRAYIYAFPRTLNISVAGNTEFLVSHNALQTTTDHDTIHAVVTKTLLEADALVNLANDNGDTALMLCVHRLSATSSQKLSYLIDYGAKIDRFNVCFQNVLHLAVEFHNVDAVRQILQVRDAKLKQHRSRVQLSPDPIHLQDEFHETPMMVLHRSEKMEHKTRREIIYLLREAGAVADADLDTTSRAAHARNRGAVLPNFGMANCQLLGEFLLFVNVHKADFSMDVTICLDTLCMSVDVSQSVLPPSNFNEFDIKMLCMRCMKQQFDFSGDVDGLDFDIHFNICDEKGFDTEVVGCNDGSDFKLAIRFPRGPCPISLWTQDLEFEPVFQWNINMNKRYTLAHYAATASSPRFQSRLLSMARPLCNPLIKCSMGFTAAETLQKQLVGKRASWDIKRLLASMQRDQKYMITYIHRDALLFMTTDHSSQTKIAGNKKKKRPSYISPFWKLSDDVCRIILSYI
jgi:hypothetical protein